MSALAERVAFVLAASLIAACPTRPPFPPPVPVDVPACSQAEHRLRALECDWAVSPKGKPFSRVCEEVAAAGVDLAPRCIAASTSCEEARKCRP